MDAELKQHLRTTGILVLILLLIPWLMLPVLLYTPLAQLYILVFLSYVVLSLYTLFRISRLIWKLPLPKIGRQLCFMLMLIIFPVFAWHWYVYSFLLIGIILQ